jgi:hypothetical protein
LETKTEALSLDIHVSPDLNGMIGFKRRG